MIISPVEFQADASKSTDNTTDIIIKLRFDVSGNEWSSILRRKNNVVEEVGVRVRHVDRALSNIIRKSAPQRSVTRSAGFADIFA
jgi:hypothetical protein